MGQGAILRGPKEAQAQGAATSNEILATIPQVTNLLVTVSNSRLGVATNQIQVIGPNLRNLSPETGGIPVATGISTGNRIFGVPREFTGISTGIRSARYGNFGPSRPCVRQTGDSLG